MTAHSCSRRHREKQEGERKRAGDLMDEGEEGVVRYREVAHGCQDRVDIGCVVRHVCEHRKRLVPLAHQTLVNVVVRELEFGVGRVRDLGFGIDG
jgi:hypothetical protein